MAFPDTGEIIGSLTSDAINTARQYYFVTFWSLLFRTRPNATVAFRNFEEEARQSAWDSEQNATSSSRDNLASLYRPPFDLMFNGPFDKVSCMSYNYVIFSVRQCYLSQPQSCSDYAGKTASHPQILPLLPG